MQPVNPDRGSLEAHFGSLISTSLRVQVGVNDPTLEKYLTALVVGFLRADAPPVRIGMPLLPQVVRLATDADAIDPSAGQRENAIRLHQAVGDAVLFVGGMFPNQLSGKRLPKPKIKRAPIVDEIKLARSSYRRASELARAIDSAQAGLFRRLSQGFETFMFSLQIVGDEVRLRKPT